MKIAALTALTALTTLTVLTVLTAGCAGGETAADAQVEPTVTPPTVTATATVTAEPLQEERDQLAADQEALQQREDALDARAQRLDKRDRKLDQRKLRLDRRERKVSGAERRAKRNRFGDGVWLVGPDIKPGTYRTQNASGSCYWARLNGTSGDFDDLITNGIPDGPAVVTIAPSDKAFESTRCGQWNKIG